MITRIERYGGAREAGDRVRVGVGIVEGDRTAADRLADGGKESIARDRDA
jgi:hypothetical protein